MASCKYRNPPVVIGDNWEGCLRNWMHSGYWREVLKTQASWHDQSLYLRKSVRLAVMWSRIAAQFRFCPGYFTFPASPIGPTFFLMLCYIAQLSDEGDVLLFRWLGGSLEVDVCCPWIYKRHMAISTPSDQFDPSESNCPTCLSLYSQAVTR